MPAELGAFLAVAVAVIVTPGPDTALTIRNTLVGGRGAGLGTAVGVAAGQAVWTLAASAGVAALLVASETAFAVVKYAGAAYLVYLGCVALWKAATDRGASDPTPARTARRLAPRTAGRQGLVSNLTNPKMAAFFTSLLPQFAGPDAGFAELLGLGLLFCSMTLVWLSLYAAVVARAGDVLRRPRPRRVLEAVSGAALVALGVRLASD
jgi:threonine/homoserine/homoserine lactone efflux protein